LKISKVLQQKDVHIWLFFLGIAVIEMSQSSWLVAGVLPGIERQPRKKLEPSPERLLALLHGWRDEAVGAGKEITRIAVAFESPFLQRRVSKLSVPVRQVKLSAAVIEACRKKSAVGAHTTEVKSTRARTTALSAVTPKCRCSP
jgi:hypothetical protein